MSATKTAQKAPPQYPAIVYENIVRAKGSSTDSQITEFSYACDSFELPDPAVRLEMELAAEPLHVPSLGLTYKMHLRMHRCEEDHCDELLDLLIPQPLVPEICKSPLPLATALHLTQDKWPKKIRSQKDIHQYLNDLLFSQKEALEIKKSIHKIKEVAKSRPKTL